MEASGSYKHQDICQVIVSQLRGCRAETGFVLEATVVIPGRFDGTDVRDFRLTDVIGSCWTDMQKLPSFVSLKSGKCRYILT